MNKEKNPSDQKSLFKKWHQQPGLVLSLVLYLGANPKTLENLLRCSTFIEG
jgi:hypothetical protein